MRQISSVFSDPISTGNAERRRRATRILPFALVPCFVTPFLHTDLIRSLHIGLGVVHDVLIAAMILAAAAAALCGWLAVSQHRRLERAGYDVTLDAL